MIAQSCSLASKPSDAELKVAYEAATKLKQLAMELGEIFPERDELINQIVFALLMREHVLVYGMYGTGKSDLLRTVFGCITDSKQFSIGLNKFMKESDIIGLPNPKLMRDEGIIKYDPEGGILRAQFVELDEILDANSPVLRTLLTLLNERQFKRGRQLESAMLHTAVASTNWSPAEAIAHDGGLGAVLDRFIFHSQVSYLDDKDSRLQMYTNYLGGAKPSVSISYQELLAISNITVGPCQIQNPLIMTTYDDVLSAFRAEMDGKMVVSDRRACKLMKCMEANALLSGRYEVDIEDLRAVGVGLCVGGDQEQAEIFDGIVEDAIASAKKNSISVDDAVMQLLDQYERQLPSIPAKPTADDMIRVLQTTQNLRAELDSVVTTVDSAERRRQDLLGTLTGIQTDALDIIQHHK